MLAFGGDNFFNVSESGLVRHRAILPIEALVRKNRPLKLMEVGDATLTFGAETVATTSTRYNSRRGGARLPVIGERCHVAIDGRCEGGWRFLATITSNLLVGRDRRILNAPGICVRSANVVLSTPAEETASETQEIESNLDHSSYSLSTCFVSFDEVRASYRASDDAYAEMDDLVYNVAWVRVRNPDFDYRLSDLISGRASPNMFDSQ